MRGEWVLHNLPHAYRIDIGILTRALRKRLGNEYSYAIKARISEKRGVKSLAEVKAIHISRGETKIALLDVVHGGGKVVKLPESHGGGKTLFSQT